MATPKEQMLAEISSTFDMTIIIWTLKKIIHGHISGKKNFKYAKNSYKF
jgi:hypothetical protein